MYIVKREILDRDLKSIHSIDYMMYTNYSSASKEFEELKETKYYGGATLYEMIEGSIGFRNVDEVVSHMYNHGMGKIIDSFDKHII